MQVLVVQFRDFSQQDALHGYGKASFSKNATGEPYTSFPGEEGVLGPSVGQCRADKGARGGSEDSWAGIVLDTG